MLTRKTLIDNFDTLPHMADFQNTAHWLAVRGWSEGAGGNMSVRLDVPKELHSIDIKSLPVHVPHLAEKALLLTRSGSRMRETALSPACDIGLYKIGEDGKSYGWLAGNNTPTSELAAHCAIHNALAKHRPHDKAIMHTHPANLVSLCHIPKLANAARISDKILRLQSEARLHLPEGIGYVDHELPGSLDLGLASAAQVKHHRLVLWHMHGCLATGADLASAFDYMEIFEKCARIFWTLRGAGVDPEGMTDQQLKKTLKAFGLYDRYSGFD